ncbi:hypothetical protein ACFQL0_01795 [Haloplanus litoreus]|uniref:hypothetical protein n=1 Tax=Haloplanus litoreus TaxID=767515 RepID=UPI0036090F58
MTRFETLPEDAHAKLKTDPRHTNGNELLPATVATTMRGHDRPIWTASQMQAELDTGHGKETVRNKLNTLEEIGICASMRANGGRIYWWDDERSDWPLPPDVAVEGREGPTLAEVLDPWYAKVGLIGLLSPAVAGVPIVAGVLAVGGALSLPIEERVAVDGVDRDRPVARVDGVRGAPDIRRVGDRRTGERDGVHRLILSAGSRSRRS